MNPEEERKEEKQTPAICLIPVKMKRAGRRRKRRRRKPEPGQFQKAEVPFPVMGSRKVIKSPRKGETILQHCLHLQHEDLLLP